MTGVLRGCFEDKRANLKTEVTRKESAPNFPFVCVSGGKKCLFFEEFDVLSCYIRFEIPPFALSPTNLRFNIKENVN